MLVNSIVGELPKPAEMPINAAHRARAPGYGWGHHGSHQMSLSSEKGIQIRISARELMELLSGRRTSKQADDLHGWLDPENPPISGLPGNPFEAQCRDGRLPVAISVTRTDEDDSDDWIEFQFGPSDPAITPFR